MKYVVSNKKTGEVIAITHSKDMADMVVNMAKCVCKVTYMMRG